MITVIVNRETTNANTQFEIVWQLEDEAEAGLARRLSLSVAAIILGSWKVGLGAKLPLWGCGNTTLGRK
jgi:hypothetical protein